MRAVGLVLVLAAGCSGPGSYVWVSDLPSSELGGGPAGEYLIRDGDLVSVRVFNQEPLSTHAKVRADGRIAMPVIGDVEARGKRPSALKNELEARLKDYVNTPSVTVTVEESQPISVSVLGEVTRVGTYPLDPRATVAQALAAAGGVTDYASLDRIFVVRTHPRPLRVRFTYENVTRGDTASASFLLLNGDLVIVE